MRSDQNTTIYEIRELLRDFRDKRNWAQFHDAKNLAEAISIEAAELLQLFLWNDKAAITEAINKDHEFKRNIEEELADIFCFGLNLANSLEIDVSSIIRRKIALNRSKYPVSKSKGVATKYNKL